MIRQEPSRSWVDESVSRLRPSEVVLIPPSLYKHRDV